MDAVWVSDYDMHEDKCYKRPGCSECKEPVFLYEDGKYHCVSCGKIVEVADNKMKNWYAEREETKVEMEDCFPSEIKMRNGQIMRMGCGGKKCVEVHYYKNPVTLKWQVAGGHCTKCNMKFMV